MMGPNNASKGIRSIPTTSVEPVLEKYLPHVRMRRRMGNHMALGNPEPYLLVEFCPLRNFELESGRRLSNVMHAGKPADERLRSLVVILEKRRNATLHRSRQPATPQLASNACGIPHMYI